MPLTLTVPEKEYFDPQTNRFFTVKKTTVTLEHSLISISKWESKWHKAYFARNEKTAEEVVDYIRCMSINQVQDDNVFKVLTSDKGLVDQILKYIQDPMTATTVNNGNKKPSRDIITNELIYYWMVSLKIPFEPCQKWHINRLLKLIEVCSIKNTPPKKMSKGDIMRRNAALNAQRRAKYHTSG